ncbi:DUF3048 domain-containing protein [Candidatus Saccharibacteria bacterium]|nr:DUF3048 domain-containing protein [Candidatus Saccharibacteria bacterium]
MKVTQKKSFKNTKIFQALSRHRVVVLLIFGALLISGALITAFHLLQPSISSSGEITFSPKAAEKHYSLLTGVEVADEESITKPTTVVVLENSPEARPQSGLKQAEVVYEAIAEGGITRFLAIYQQNTPGLVGPVRSLRMYYVDWLAPYDASVAHVGGSASALNEIRNGNYRDIDQMSNPNAYWRASDRYAPHNVYTSFERIAALNSEKGYTQSNFEGFRRKTSSKTQPVSESQPTAATNVQINFGSQPTYNTRYEYNAESKTYNRFQADAPHLDREEGALSPSVVIALDVQMSRVQEDGYRESITTTGQGTARVFQNGEVIEGIWRKDSRQDQLKFFTADGAELPLEAGQTWIAAVPQNGGSVSWQ